MAIVTLAKVDDRTEGVQRSLRAVDMAPVKGREVLIKPNFNTADITPGSTHNDTLVALVEALWDMGAGSVAIGERSYPRTRRVMEEKGILPLLKERDVRVIDFDTLQEEDWVYFQPKGSHWPDGFRVARPVIEADYLISTCCLKTHQYGGVFTMSLKLHVGTVPTSRNGFPYMGQLHQSRHQEEMIAEINTPFSPDLILLDGIDAFVDGGPAYGERARGNVFLASRDRVAADAAGVAVLKLLGSNSAIMDKAIFQQKQIARAGELGIGVSSPEEIEVVPADPDSEEYSKQVGAELKKG